MAKFRGTQGPWKYNEGGYKITSVSSGITIADTYESYCEYGENRANAFLLSAAPELLEALQNALEWIDAVPANLALPAMPGFDRDEVNNIISKALGESDERI